MEKESHRAALRRAHATGRSDRPAQEEQGVDADTQIRLTLQGVAFRIGLMLPLGAHTTPGWT
jgi:hypothetical protein